MKKFIVYFAASTFGAAMLAGAPSARAATASPSPAAIGQPPQYYPNQPWAVPPSQWQAAEQKGYREGVRGAYKDAQNHRQPNVNNRDEYRHPDDIPGGDVGAYRQGFRRGYWTGVQHLMGYYHGPYNDRDDRR